MIIIIPMGGLGERFKQNGYALPKGLIKVFGRPILYYLLDSLKGNRSIECIYIPYNKEYASYRFEDVLKKDYPTLPFKFLKLVNNTGGAAETLNIALRELTCPDTPILSLDGDNFYTTDILSLWNSENKVIVFEDIRDNPIFSYVQIQGENVVNIVEKQKISNYACTGAYGFASYKQLFHYTQKILDHNITHKGEYYISTAIQEMLKDNIRFQYAPIHVGDWHCLGTPIQVKQFYNNFPKMTSLHKSLQIKKLRVCFDLDNTLVTFPKRKDDYTSVEPITQNIAFLRYLKELGHTIIVYTARRMNTHAGNTGKVLCDIGKLTFDTLDRFQIPFDEIYFGKPNADIYIDDLALNCYDNLEKSLGFYMDTISPRDFNQLTSESIETYTKKSDDLSGEIHYYENIPKQIKDLFPVLLDRDGNNKWYTMEKVQGLTITSMYLSEILTCDTLRYIMDSIRRIQSVPVSEENNIPIYENYCEKLKKRYSTYDYSRFPNSETVYKALYEKLYSYEHEQKGRISCIHGDSVMSNILLNNYGKLKFIDMRGKVGTTLTIYGDWLYDWAKLYQSLIGYDKILQNKDVSKKYEQGMKQCFEAYFKELYSPSDFENLKTITQSLLFTLIPLHNNQKCVDYYNLLFTV